MPKLQSTGKKQDGVTLLASSEPRLLSLIDVLCKDGLITLVSETDDRRLPGTVRFLPINCENLPFFGSPQDDVYRRYREDQIRIDFRPQLLPSGQLRYDYRIRRCELASESSDQQGFPTVRCREIEAATIIRPRQTVVLDGGLQMRTTAPDSPPALPSGQRESGSTGKSDHRVVDVIQTLLVLTADLAPQARAETDSRTDFK
jgi:hypothetical protein